MSFHKLFTPNLTSGAIKLWAVIILFMSFETQAMQLVAHLSQHGVKGHVTFAQLTRDNPNITHVDFNLNVAEDQAGEYSWGIYEFPIDYSVPDYCHSRMLGRRPIINLSDLLGKIVLPSENSYYETTELSLSGKDSIWGRTFVLEGPSKQRICGTILPSVNDDQLTVAEARFTSPMAGSVFFTSLERQPDEDNPAGAETKIYTNLYHTQGGKSSQHKWEIFITDILDSDADLYGGNCDFLQIMYDPSHKGGHEGCSKTEQGKCSQGDLMRKFGKVKVGQRQSMFSKSYLTDLNLNLKGDVSGPRSLFLVLYDNEHEDSFLSCTKIREIKPKVAKARISYHGVKGGISFKQSSPFHPVETNLELVHLNSSAGSFHIHQLPVTYKMTTDDNPCSRTGGHWNPYRIDASVSPKPGQGSFDKYEVGDLSGKYGTLKDKDDVRGRFHDPNLSLYGKNSIVGRAIVLHNTPVPKRWICANIEEENKQILTAVAKFTYPVAGRIIFKQDQEDPLADTMVYVESLLYSDGTKNDTNGHRWHVHTDIPGKDYFNWTGRCLSAKGHFNPYQVSKDENIYNECRNEHLPYKCELGDLFNKLGALSVAGKKKNIRDTVKFFTDVNLPLSGPNSIVGHSIVIHDDHAPEHRGDRMACTGIVRQYRHKAVANNWFGNGIKPPIDGSRLEFIQNTKTSESFSLVKFKKLQNLAYAYHVHEIPVQDHLEFPCTGDAVGGHFNPFKYDKSQSPKGASGTPDQYEIGDLSGKYGVLEGKDSLKEIYNDTNLPLFGDNSIVGRSIVVHKKVKGERWACASIGWGFDPDEAREIRAIASFHHPNGYAWGYIRFSQVVYRDGSTTDTNILVRLKYPGKTNKDFTSGHKWSVYVNPVGHDASVKFFNARCTAAGYRWNPTLIQLADPNDHGFYTEECGSDYPLRCEVGDLSGRHGPLSVGGKAYVINDVNLPLSGDWYQSALGKSIVIHTPDGGSDRMACANIKEDKDIVKFASIETKARFNLATFMEEVQAIMGIPEWFLYTDTRFTKVLHSGKCLRIRLHFTGPYANKLEQDFNILLRTGKLETPSIPIPGYVPDATRKTKLSYRECGTDHRPGTTSNTINDFYSSLTSIGSSANVTSAHILSLVVTVLVGGWARYCC